MIESSPEPSPEGSGSGWYIPDGEDVIADYATTSGGTTFTRTASYVNGGGIDSKIAKLDASGAPTYYVPDALGSVGVVVDAAGQVVDTRLTNAWGEDLRAPGPDRYGFAQRERMPEIAILGGTPANHNRARTYFPELGRFGQRDPLDSVLEPYHYAANNPIMNNDPSGKYIELTQDEEAKMGEAGKSFMIRIFNEFTRPKGLVSWKWEGRRIVLEGDDKYVDKGNEVVLALLNQNLRYDTYQMLRAAVEIVSTFGDGGDGALREKPVIDRGDDLVQLWQARQYAYLYALDAGNLGLMLCGGLEMSVCMELEAGLMLSRSAANTVVIRGLYRDLSMSAVESAAASRGPTVRVLTRLTEAPSGGRALSVAVGESAEALALAARPRGTLYVAKVPKELMDLFVDSGLAQVSTTQMGNVIGTEIRFSARISRYIVELLAESSKVGK